MELLEEDNRREVVVVVVVDVVGKVKDTCDASTCRCIVGRREEDDEKAWTAEGLWIDSVSDRRDGNSFMVLIEDLSNSVWYWYYLMNWF